MKRHIAMFKFKKNSDYDENLKHFMHQFSLLKNLNPGIEVGVNMVSSPVAYDLYLSIPYETEDEYHQLGAILHSGESKEEMLQKLESMVTCDYEV